MRDFLESFPLGSNRAALAPPASDSVAQLALVAGTAQRIAIPSGARFVNVIGNPGGAVWWLFGTSTVTAAIGSAGTAGANAALGEMTRRVPDGATHLSLVADVAVKASLEFWS